MARYLSEEDHKHIQAMSEEVFGKGTDNVDGKRKRVGGGGKKNHHGFAFLDGALLASAPTATIQSYRPVEGTLPTNPTLTLVNNDHALAGADNQPCLVSKRFGSWVLVGLIEGPTGPTGGSGASDDHGFALINADYVNPLTSPLAITDYIAVEGTATPGATAVNLALETRAPQDGDLCAVSKISGVWKVTRVWPQQTYENHGLARGYDQVGFVVGYKPVEGTKYPEDITDEVTPVTIANPHGLTIAETDLVVVAELNNVWTAVEVLSDKEHHGIAQLTTDITTFVESIPISNYLIMEGTESPGVSVNNPNSLQGKQDDFILVSKTSGTWEAIQNISKLDRLVALDSGDDDNAGYLLSKLGLTTVLSAPADHTAIVGVRSPADASSITLYSADGAGGGTSDHKVDVSADDAVAGTIETKFGGSITQGVPAPVYSPLELISMYVTAGGADERFHLHTDNPGRIRLNDVDGSLGFIEDKLHGAQQLIVDAALGTCLWRNTANKLQFFYDHKIRIDAADQAGGYLGDKYENTVLTSTPDGYLADFHYETTGDTWGIYYLDEKVALDGSDTTPGHLLSKLSLTPTTIPAGYVSVLSKSEVGNAVSLWAKESKPHTLVRVLQDIDVTFNQNTGKINIQKTFIDIEVVDPLAVTGTPLESVEIWKTLVTTYLTDTVTYHLETGSGLAGPVSTDNTTDTCGSQ